MSLKQVKALAAKLGARVEDDKCGHSHECRIEAPHRKLWTCIGVHELINCAYIPWKPDYDAIISDMNYGLEDCTDPDCDWCNPE